MYIFQEINSSIQMFCCSSDVFKIDNLLLDIVLSLSVCMYLINIDCIDKDVIFEDGFT